MPIRLPILFLLLVVLLSINIPSVFAKTFEDNFFSLSSAGGSFPTSTSTILTPKNGAKIFWSFLTHNLANGRVTSETTRIHIPRNRTLYLMGTVDNIDVPLQSFSFEIESPRENNFFRIKSIDSNPLENFLPTVTLENASQFSFSLQSWKLKGEGFKFSLPDEELGAGEKRTFIAPLQQKGGTLELISPNKRTKDKVLYPEVEQYQIYQRKKPYYRKEVRPDFFIQERY